VNLWRILNPTVVHREERARRQLVTPEGVPLVFRVPAAGTRLAAFLIDVGWQALLLFLLTLPLALGSVFGGPVLAAFATLASFLVFNFYFVFFELRWDGRTPGKRALGLRVIDAGGGVLTAEAVFVRNLTRPVEVLWPLLAMLAPESLVGASSGWFTAASITWILALGLLPLFNRDRRRVGDLVAGTLVVESPKAVLLPDLGAASVSRTADGSPALRFTSEQLGVYGVYELQVLEDLLRKQQWDRAALRAVAERIQKKIGWSHEGRVEPRAFLREFYRAQRAHLEHGLLLGEARAKKRAGGKGERGGPRDRPGAW